MKKLTFWKSLFLLCALIVGSTSVWADDYEELFSISSGDIVSGNSYASQTAEVANRDYVITFGGNNASVGTNKGNRGNCNLSSYSKYAVSPVTTTSVASAFACTTSISDVSKISYTFDGGSNQSSTNVYLLYSDDNTTFSQIELSSGTQGDDISSGYEFEFTKCSGYFALLFVATNKSGNWRIDDVEITFYKTAAQKTATTTTITSTGITNTDLKNGTVAGSLSAAVTYGDPATAVPSASVTWSSEDKTVATVNETTGVVTLVGVGTTDIKASYAGNDTYAASSDTYEITVTDSRIPTTTTIISTGITNTDLKNGTAAGSLSAAVTVTAGGAAVDGATVTWSSKDENVATINETTGVVTLVGIGTTEITASFAGAGDYTASSATYDLTVTDSRQPATVEIDFNDTFFGTKITTWKSTDPTSITKEKNNISVTYAKNDSKYYYISAEIRMYAEMNTGGSTANTLTFEAPENYLISSVDLTQAGGTWGTLASTPTGFDNTDKEWTSETPASSVELEATSGTCRISKATVTLARKLDVAYADGWMSYVTPCDVTFPDNVEAYIVTATEPNITREKITAAPEGTPVVLHATDGTGSYGLPIPDETPAALTTNKLKVSDGSITIDDDNYKKIYVLTVVSNKAGFGPLKKGNTLAAGKAYIEYATAQARDFFAFDGETTGIANVDVNENIGANAPMYNLAGQRVNKSYKGVVIVNGKKMLNK